MRVTIARLSEMLGEALRSAGYMESTIAVYADYLRLIAKDSQDGCYSKAVGEAFLSHGTSRLGGSFSPKTVVFRERIVRILDSWMETGSFDLSFGREKAGPPTPASQGLVVALSEYARANDEAGLADETKKFRARIARCYAMFLESRGTLRLEESEAVDALEFVAGGSRAWTGTAPSSVIDGLRPLLIYLGKQESVNALAMAGIRRESKPVPTLTDGERESIAAACCSGDVPARDAAIALLALTTGVRACDVVALRLRDIDWASSTISLVQRKTGNPLTIPMVPALSEAMARYILEDRPYCESGHVFVGSKAPHGPFADHAAVYRVIKKVFAAAGVDGRAGTRVLRHSAATGMLRSGAALPVISAVLGHADPRSADAYLEVDEERMRACVLPLPEGVAR